MFGLLLRRLVNRWFYRLSKHNIPHMPLFALVDLPLIVVLPLPLWIQQVRRLRKMQQHFTRRVYTGLDSIYPRHHLHTYLYMLFAWGRYCGVLPKLLAQPDRAVLAEMFIRYICEIDHYLDTFDSRQLLQENPQVAWRREQVQAIGSEFCALLRQLELSPKTRWQCLRLVVIFRRAYFEEMRCSAAFAAGDVATMLRHKERTAGDLWRTWALVLGQLYGVPSPLADHAAEVQFTFGMLVQLLDDIADLPVDYRTVTPNLFLAMIEQTPAELARLQRRLQTDSAPFLNLPWSQQQLPQAYAKLFSLYEDYADGLRSGVYGSAVTLEMLHTIEAIRRHFSR